MQPATRNSGQHFWLRLVLLAASLAYTTANAGLTVLGVQYQPDQMFPEFPCIWHADCHLDTAVGCHVHVYLKNTGAVTETISDATLNTPTTAHSLETVLKDGNIVGARSIYFYWDNPPQDIIDAGEPVWYKANPRTIPPGGVAQVVIRLRYIPTTPTVTVGVVASSGTVATNITVNAATPQLASIGYASDRTKIYLHWRRPTGGSGAAPTSILMDGVNVTANTTTVGDANVNFAASVISPATPFAPMSNHVYQGVYADGKIASASQRAWTNKFIYSTYGNFTETANYTMGDWVAEASDHGVNNCQEKVGPIIGYMNTTGGEADCRAHGFGYTSGDTSKFNATDPPIDPDMFFLNDEPDAQEDNQAQTHCGTGTKIPCGSGHTTGILVMSEIAHGEELRALRPNTPTSVNMNGTLKPLNYISWGQAFDVLQVDPYYQRRLSDSYWFNTFEIPLYAKATYIYAVSRAVTAAAEPNPSNVLLYSCEWKQNVNGTDMIWPFPTRESKRIEVYYALAAGARGMGYWWMPGNYPSKGLDAQTPTALACWKEIGLLGNEIKTAAPLLVRSTPVTMPLTPGTNVWVRSLASGTDSMILIVVNDNNTNDIAGCHYTPVSNAVVTAMLPSWLQSPMAFEISAAGLRAVNTQPVGNQLQLNLGTLQLTRMVVLTKDPQPLQIQQRYDQQVRQGVWNMAPEYGTNSAPAIVVPPHNLSVGPGDNAAFFVAVSGVPVPTYQWRFNGADLAGATNPSYTRTNAQDAFAGGYSVRVANGLGAVTSQVATLTVSSNGLPPVILASPQNQTVAQGSNATFTVTASSSQPLSYQWRFNDSDIPGATASAFTRLNAQPVHAGYYAVVVSNAAGIVTSAPAALVVTIPVVCPTVTLVNPGFEGASSGGLAAGWTAYQRSGTPAPTNVYSIQTAGPPPGGGSQYQQVANTSSTGGGGVRQNVTGCVIGATYQVSGWMRGNSALATCRVKVSPTASTSFNTAIDLNPPQFVSTNNWVPFSGTVVATSTNMTIWLDGQTGGTGQNKAECFDSITVVCAQAPPPLYFASIGILPQNNVRLVVSGEAGKQVTVRRSGDMVNWVTLTNLVNTNGVLLFNDSSGTGAAQRFYRATSP